MTVNVIGQRMNFMVILHGCWLVVILTRRRRAAIARLWPKYCLFLVIFLLYQYLLCVGMPPALCVGKGRGARGGHLCRGQGGGGPCVGRLPAPGKGLGVGGAGIKCAHPFPQTIRGAGARPSPSTRRSSSGSTCPTSSCPPNPPTSSVSTHTHTLAAPCPRGHRSPWQPTARGVPCPPRFGPCAPSLPMGVPSCPKGGEQRGGGSQMGGGRS